MSDDEEIIYKGKSVGLCNYLTELGYVDFDTFEPENVTKEELSNEAVNNAVSRPDTLNITDHNYRKLDAILGSQLLFKEDAHTVESLLHNKHVYNQRPNYVFHTSVVLTGLLSSVIMHRTNVNLGIICKHVVPAGFTVVFSCYSLWTFYKEFVEEKNDCLLITHINDLKNLCLNALKLTRFIKETEILSTGQVAGNDIGPVLYAPLSKQQDTHKDDVLPNWKTLPHLRKCLSDTLEEVLNMLTASVNSLRQSLSDRQLPVIEKHLSYTVKDNLTPRQISEQGFYSVTPNLLDIKELTSKYLSVQSEYLKELAFIFSSVLLKDTLSDKQSHKLSRDKVFEMFVNSHKKLKGMSFKLMMHCNVHSMASSFKSLSYKSSSRIQVTEINELQSGVHNIFLLLYSALLRVRNLEDTLENVSEMRESSYMAGKVNVKDVTEEQLTVLKDDLITTLRCYDVLCQQSIGRPTSKKKVDNTTLAAENGSRVIQENIKETGIVVGTSDFTVNSPDEVFLSLSGTTNNEETSISECLDDWCLERRPDIPKCLLRELSQTLKSRKTDFIEREKYALKQKGLQDIEILSRESDGDSCGSEGSFSRKRDRRSIKYNRNVPAQDYSHSSDSDDEMDPFESGAFLTKLKISKKYNSDLYSDSDSSLSDNALTGDNKSICQSEVACAPRLSTSSLANLAALKSQMWGGNKEEHYSDGSES